MELLTIRDFFIEYVVQRNDQRIIEVLTEIGIAPEEILQFLEFEESQGDQGEYGTFWKRFIKFLMESKIQTTPVIDAIMNPMRLILQNLRSPIPVVDLKYENQFDGETVETELSQYSFIDGKVVSNYLSLGDNSSLHLLNGMQHHIEIQIQQISTFRGVDVAIGQVVEEGRGDDAPNDENAVAWTPCESSLSAILSVNVDLLRLLSSELTYPAEKWLDVLLGKNVEANERHLVQVSHRLADLVEGEAQVFFNLRGVGIVRAYQGDGTADFFLQYLYGAAPPRHYEIDTRHAQQYAQYLEAAHRFQAEEAERLRREQEEAEEAERRRIEEEAEAERRRVEEEEAAERERLRLLAEAEERERQRLQREREEAEERERLRLEEERRMRAEAEERERQRKEQEALAEAERIRQEQLRREREEAERLRKQREAEEQAERERLAKEARPATPEPQPRAAASPGLTPEPQRENANNSPVLLSPPAAPAPVPTKNNSAALLDFEERDDMTLAERRELRKRREEYEKQRKLQEFLRVEGNTTDFLPSVQSLDHQQMAAAQGGRKKSVKDRFLIAQQQQQEQESERLAKFKNDPNKRIDSSAQSTASVRNKWNDGSAYEQSTTSSSSSAPVNPADLSSASQDLSMNKSRLRSKWEGVLQDTKTTEVNRFQHTKQSTISQFRITQGTGIVKKRIGEWEELFLQIAATNEQLEEFLRVAQALSDRKDHSDGLSHEQLLELQTNFLAECQNPEDFVINDTHIYSSRLFPALLHSLLKKQLAESKTPNHFTLSCGVYGETDQKPPIDVFAFAIRTAQGKIYVALTVKAALGKDLDINVYGLKKVSVFLQNPKDGTKTNIFEKLLNVLPLPGWEAWIPEGLYEEMRAIVNYNKTLSASRAASFYNASTSQQQGTSNSLDDFDFVETIAEEPADRKDKVDALALPSTSLDEEEEEKKREAERAQQQLDEAEMLQKDQPQPEQAELADDLALAEEALDKFDDQALGNNGNGFGNGGKRFSTSSTTESIPPDEGEGTWVDSLTPPNAKGAGGFQQLADLEPVTLLADSQQRHGPHDGDSSLNARRSDEADDADLAEAEDIAVPGPHNMQLFEGQKLGEFSDDEDDDDDEEDDDATHNSTDDDNEEHYHFGKSPVLVSATVARVYTATPANSANTAFMRSKHNQNKFSWPLEAELETKLESGQHSSEYLNLRDVRTTNATATFFLLQSTRSTAVFTGTMAHGHTDSVYVLEGDKVFEWVRGAAASGWCWKFPMKTQNFGRLRKRFFILRDNVLSYHKSKPKHEEDVASAFSHNTLHLTDNSTITIGRKRLQKCLIVTTPFDTLWLKMKKDFTTEAVKWIGEINKAIQFFNRPKLILSKPRIESKWYHESPSFSLVSVDVVSQPLDDSYCKVGLFCLKIPIHTTRYQKERKQAGEVDDDDMGDICSYSVDIATNDTQRLQVEILNEDETINLDNRLSVVKIYGDYLLLGGSKGYLALGVLSKTKATNMLLTTPGANNKGTPGAGSASPSVSTAKRVVFAVPLIDKMLELSVAHSNEQRKSTMEDAPHTERRPSQPAIALNYPHQPSGDITAIGVAQCSSVFAVADSNLLLSLWYIPRNARLHNLSVRSSVSNPNGMKKFQKRLKVYVITVLSLKQLDAHPESSSNNKSSSNKKRKSGSSRQFSQDNAIVERVLKLKFLLNDSYLLVCTNRRMLLLAVQFQPQSHAPAMHAPMGGAATATGPHQAFEEAYSRGTSMDFSSLQSTGALTAAFQSNSAHANAMVRNILGFSGWLELDRAVPRCCGVFDFFISDEPSADGSRRIVQWRAAEMDDEDEGKETTSLTSSLLSSWGKGGGSGKDSTSQKSSSSAGGGAGSGSGSEGILRKCTVSRLNWSPQMFADVLTKLKPCPLYLPFDTVALDSNEQS